MMDLTIAEWIMIMPTIIGVFAVMARYTENKSNDKIVQMALDVVNFLAQNLGKAKNK